MVWLDRSELGQHQISNIMSQLTVRPRRTTTLGNEGPPDPIYLYDDQPEKGLLGVPRGYYAKVKSLSHQEVVRVSNGEPMLDLKTGWKAASDGPYAEQVGALANLMMNVENQKWGGMILQAGCGFGKTAVGIELARRVGRKTLILVHETFFLRQWKNAIKKFLPGARVGFLQQDRCDYKDVDFTIAMIQSLSGDGWKKYPPEIFEAFGMSITDESLPYDAQILTEDGYRKIGEIVGDDHPARVVSYNKDSGQFVLRNITRRWVHPPRCQMVEVTHEHGSFRVTENHVVVTPTGDVAAKDLVVGVDCVVCTGGVKPKRNVQGEDGACGGISDGGRLPVEAEEGRQGTFSGVARGEATGFGNGEVRRVARLGEDSTEGEAKSRMGQQGVGVLDAGAGGLVGCVGSILPERQEEAVLRSSRQVLVAEDAGVVGDGRRQSRGEGSSSAHGGVREGGCREDCRMADRSWPGVIGDEGQKLLDRVILKPGIEGCRNDDSRAHDSVAVVQDGCACEACGADDVRSLRGRDSEVGDGPKAEVLPGSVLPDCEESSVVRILGDEPKGNCGAVSESGLSGVRHSVAAGCWESEESEGLQRSAVREGCGDISLANPVPREAARGLGGHPVASRILSVTPVDTPELVYDLSVDEFHNFVTEGAVVHNCHRIGAATWADVVRRFNTAWRLGLTATPKRLDGAQDVFFQHIGPIAYIAETQAQVPLLRKLFTVTELKGIKRGEYKVPVGRLNTSQVATQLVADKFRTRDIVDQIVSAVEAGRKILVVSERLQQLKDLAEDLGTILFDRKLGFTPTIDFYTGSWFTGEMTKKVKGRKSKPRMKSRTEEDLEKAEMANVIFATKQMVSEGLDIQALDVIVFATPLGDIEQAVGRVRRWCEPEPGKCEHYCAWRAGKCKGKPQPIVLDVIDERCPALLGKWKRRAKFYRKIGTL